MPVLIFLLGLVLALVAIAILAAIAAAAVPALLLDPTNWWGWVGLLVIVSAVLGGTKAAS